MALLPVTPPACSWVTAGVGGALRASAMIAEAVSELPARRECNERLCYFPRVRRRLQPLRAR